jgi:hypothetical protein
MPLLGHERPCADCGVWTPLRDPRWDLPCCETCLGLHHSADVVAQIVLAEELTGRER